MNIFLTGKPGSGKTTLLKSILEELDRTTCGFFTPEIREDGERTGFRIEDLKTGDKGVLASVELEEGPSVSKYRVNLKDLKRFSDKVMEDMENSEVVVIDEIGVMELYSDEFKDLLNRAMTSDKLLLATLHRSLVEDYGDEGKVIWVTRSSAEDIKGRLVELVDYS
ncbi:MAG: NTPase [Candidatus Aenigmatarchaeota archaeon]